MATYYFSLHGIIFLTQYAAGGVLMSFVYVYCFKDFVMENGFKDKYTRFLWVLASILYGLQIAAVAIQFEYGFYVAFALISILFL